MLSEKMSNNNTIITTTSADVETNSSCSATTASRPGENGKGKAMSTLRQRWYLWGGVVLAASLLIVLPVMFLVVEKKETRLISLDGITDDISNSSNSNNSTNSTEEDNKYEEATAVTATAATSRFGPKTRFLLSESTIRLGDTGSIQLELDTNLSVSFDDDDVPTYPISEAFLRYVGTVNDTVTTELALQWIEIGDTDHEYEAAIKAKHTFEKWHQKLQMDYASVKPLIRTIQVRNDETASWFNLTVHVFQADLFATSILFQDPAAKVMHPTQHQPINWLVTCPDPQIDCLALMQATLFVADNQTYHHTLLPTIRRLDEYDPNMPGVNLLLRPATLLALNPMAHNSSNVTSWNGIADFMIHHYKFCKYSTQPCVSHMYSNYETYSTPTYSIGYNLNWFGIHKWNDPDFQDWDVPLGQIAQQLQLKQENPYTNADGVFDANVFAAAFHTTISILDGGSLTEMPTPALVLNRTFDSIDGETRPIEQTSVYFEDPHGYGGWSFRCSGEFNDRNACLKIFPSYLQLLPTEQIYDRVTSGLYILRFQLNW